MRKHPLISICIPTFNRAHYLKECLDCIIEQDWFDPVMIEIVISDNDSPDNTESLVEKYQKKYSNIHYFRNSKNIWANLNLFKVSEYATGEYIWFMWDDDQMLPWWLKNVIDAITGTNDVVLFQTNSLESVNETLVIQEGIAYFKKLIHANRISHLIVFMLFLSMVIVKRENFTTNLESYSKEFPHKLAEAYSHFYVLIRCIHHNRIALIGRAVGWWEWEEKDNGYFKNNSKVWYDLVIVNGIDKIYEDTSYLNSIWITNDDLAIYRWNFIKVYYLNRVWNFFKSIWLYDPIKLFFVRYIKKYI